MMEWTDETIGENERLLLLMDEYDEEMLWKNEG